MGKTDKGQPKISFENKTTRSRDPSTEDASGKRGPPNEDQQQDLKSILTAMEKNLQGGITALGTKMDALSYRIDRMAKRLDKQAERIDMSKHRISEIEEAHTTLDSEHKQLGRVLQVIQDKTEDLEARSRRCNLRLIGLPESIQTGKMEQFI